MHLLDAGRILDCDDRRPSRGLIDNEAVQMHDSVPDRDLEADRPPISRIDRSCDAVADMVIVRGRIGNFAGQARNEFDRFLTSLHGAIEIDWDAYD